MENFVEVLLIIVRVKVRIITYCRRLMIGKLRAHVFVLYPTVSLAWGIGETALNFEGAADVFKELIVGIYIYT